MIKRRLPIKIHLQQFLKEIGGKEKIKKKKKNSNFNRINELIRCI